MDLVPALNVQTVLGETENVQMIDMHLIRKHLTKCTLKTSHA